MMGDCSLSSWILFGLRDFVASPLADNLSESTITFSVDGLQGVHEDMLDDGNFGDDTFLEDDEPAVGSISFADLFPSNVGLSFTIIAVILSIPVPSFIVSGARQWSNSYKY